MHLVTCRACAQKSGYTCYVSVCLYSVVVLRIGGRVCQFSRDEFIYIYIDKDKINLQVYFIRFIHYKLVSYDKQCLPHLMNLNSPDECGKHCLSYETSL